MSARVVVEELQVGPQRWRVIIERPNASLFARSLWVACETQAEAKIHARAARDYLRERREAD